MESNRELSRTHLAKADMTVKDMTDNGGLMKPAQAQTFMDLAIKKSVALGLMTPKTLTAQSQEIDKLGFLSRITRRGQEGKSLPEGSRAKPDLGKITISTVPVKFQINLNDFDIDDNIEGDNLVNHIQNLASERFALDCEDLAFNGDVNSTDDFLSLQDGFLAKATSHVIDDGVSVIALTHFLHLVQGLPDEYQRDTTRLRFMMAPNMETKVRDLFGGRATPGGDAALTSTDPIPVYGIKPIRVPVMPTNLGVGTNESPIVFTDPANMVYGIWRSIKIKMQEDIEAGVIKIVGRARIGFEYFHEPAVAKAVKTKVA